MATASADQLYPFSTQDSDSIPLEIIRPTGVIKKSFTLGLVDIAFPTSMKLAVFYSEEGCFVQFGTTLPSPLVDGTHYVDTLFVPPQTFITAVVPAIAAKVTGLTKAGTLVVQGIYKWAALALPRQINNIL